MSLFGEWFAAVWRALSSGRASSGATENTQDFSTAPQTQGLQAMSELVNKPRVSCDVEPEDFEPSFEGFEKYIEAIGARRVSAKELLTPHNRAVADDLGYQWLLPSRSSWAHLVPLIDIFEIIRDAVDAPIVVRNWWRPADYNAKVGGAKASDHITAHAFDCDFKTHDQRREAERIVVEMQQKRPDLALSLGLGGYTIHLGACSPKGKRTWKYDSYVP